MNLTDYAILNKLKLTKPQANLIAKLDGMGVIVSDLPRMVHNQVNGFGDTLNPFSAALVEWVYDCSRSYNGMGPMRFNGHKVAIQTFDRVRYLILALDKSAYQDFID